MSSPKTNNYSLTRIILSVYMVICFLGIGIGAIILGVGFVRLVEFWIYNRDSGAYTYMEGMTGCVQGISIMFAGATSLVLARLVIVLTDIAISLKSRDQ